MRTENGVLLLHARLAHARNQSQPLISLFEDQIEILSHGGLPARQTRELFFQGISTPRNDMLMRVFLNMKLTEHTGNGIPTIVNQYGQDVFHIEEHFINVVIPFDKEVAALCQQNGKIKKELD